MVLWQPFAGQVVDFKFTSNCQACNDQNGHTTECPCAGLIQLGFVCRSDAPQCHGTSCCQPCCSLLAKTVAQESNKPWPQGAGPHDATATSHRSLHAIRTCFVLDHTTQAVIVIKIMTKCVAGTPILHAETSFISAERGLRWTSCAALKAACLLSCLQMKIMSFGMKLK